MKLNIKPKFELIAKTKGQTAAKLIKSTEGRKAVEEALAFVMKARYPHLTSDINSLFSSHPVQVPTLDIATSQAI